MPVQSKDPREIFPNFSSLFGQASKMNVKIDGAALTQLLSVTVQLNARKTPVPPSRRIQALAEWSALLQQKQGQVLDATDIWEWIKKWIVPDPVHADRLWRHVILTRSEEAGARE
ncbi:MAG: hypothetical protein LAO56_13755 [Acidobacteriia bacterium]|nr:hypothetical protein [Terriglobia bacterium]